MIELFMKLMHLLPIAAMLAGCASPGKAENRVVFICPGGESITADFRGQEKVAVTMPDGSELVLPIAPSGSGARYSNGEVTLWNKGDMVFFMRGDDIVLDDCRAIEK